MDEKHEPKLCRKCQEPLLKNGTCRNGCSQLTAAPPGGGGGNFMSKTGNSFTTDGYRKTPTTRHD